LNLQPTRLNAQITPIHSQTAKSHPFWGGGGEFSGRLQYVHVRPDRLRKIKALFEGE